MAQLGKEYKIEKGKRVSIIKDNKGGGGIQVVDTQEEADRINNQGKGRGSGDSGKGGGDSNQPTASEIALGMSLPESMRYLPVEEIKASQSLQAGQSIDTSLQSKEYNYQVKNKGGGGTQDKATIAEIVYQQSLPENIRNLSLSEIKANYGIQSDGNNLTFIPASEFKMPYIPPVVRPPAPMSTEQGPVLVTSSGQIIASASPQGFVQGIKIGYEPISNPLPYETRGTENLQPTTQFIEPYTPFNLTPTDIAKGTLTAVENIAKTSGQGYEKIAIALGVPTINKTETIKVPERKSISGGTGTYNPITNKYETLSPQIVSLASAPELGTYTTTKQILSPQLIGSTVEKGILLGAYVTPYVGSTLLGASTLRGIDTYKSTKVPTRQELLDQYKPTDITQSEYKDYLKTPEGRQFNTQVDEYIAGQRAQKTGGLIEAGLSAGLLFGTGALKAYKYEKQPVRLIDDFQALPKPQTTFMGIVQPQEKGFLAQVKTTTKMPDILGIEAPRYKVQIGKYVTGEVKGKPIIYKKGYESNFLTNIEVDELGNILAKAQPGTKVSTYQTLTKHSTYKGTPDEILLYEDVSKLPSVQKRVANELLKKPTVVTEETMYFGSTGITDKGRTLMKDPITGRELKVIKRTKSSLDLSYVEPKDVFSGEISVSASRVTPSRNINEIQFFNVETATKRTVSKFPRASGNVDLAFGEIAVLPKKVPVGITDTQFIVPTGKKSEQGLLQSLSMKEQQKLVSQTSKAVSSLSPKIKTPKSYKPITVAPQEEFLFYPKYVGGMGRRVSTYAAKGRSDQGDILFPQGYKSTTKPSQPSLIDFSSAGSTSTGKGLDFQPIDFQPPKVKQGGGSRSGSGDRSIETFGITNISGQGTNLGTLEVSGSGSGLGLGTLEVARQREDQILVPVLNEQQINIFRQPQIEVTREVQIQVPRTPQIFRQPQLFRPVTIQPPRIQPPRFRPPRTPTYPIPLYDSPKNKKFTSKRRFPKGIFITEVRRKGKFMALGKTSSLGEAVSKGRSYALGTLGASFRVRTPSGLASLTGDQTFRSAKRDSTILVQRAPKRLSSLGERAEISRSRRRGNFLI